MASPVCPFALFLRAAKFAKLLARRIPLCTAFVDYPGGWVVAGCTTPPCVGCSLRGSEHLPLVFEECVDSVPVSTRASNSDSALYGPWDTVCHTCGATPIYLYQFPGSST